jgi:choline dehydrogenase-like flavoprotein
MAPVDYVVVGAGSAGCVLANRLTEDPSVRVLLVEAGGKDRSPNIKIPAGFAKQFHTKLDWDFATEPEPHCDGRSLYLPRGKGLGGSSGMNAMLYVRGRPIDRNVRRISNAARAARSACRSPS